jgi:hypothetical protein
MKLASAAGSRNWRRSSVRYAESAVHSDGQGGEVELSGNRAAGGNLCRDHWTATRGHQRRSVHIGLHDVGTPPSQAAIRPHQAGPRRDEDTDSRAAPTLSHTTPIPPRSTTTSGRHLSPARVLTGLLRRTATTSPGPAAPRTRTTSPAAVTTGRFLLPHRLPSRRSRLAIDRQRHS